MKKTYTKPEILFEGFSMSTNIAGDCEKPYVTGATRDICGIPADFGPDVLFSLGVDGTKCNASGNLNGEYNGLCYHNPSDANNMFNS